MSNGLKKIYANPDQVSMNFMFLNKGRPNRLLVGKQRPPLQHLSLLLKIITGMLLITVFSNGLLLMHRIGPAAASLSESKKERGLLPEYYRLKKSNQALADQMERIQWSVERLETIADISGEAKGLPERLEVLIRHVARREKQRAQMENRLQKFESSARTQSDVRFSPAGPQTLTPQQKHQLLAWIPNGTPLESVRITSPYGRRIHPTLNTPEFHTGIDLAAKFGSTVLATADGVVEYAGPHQSSGYGNLLVIRHPYGFTTLFGHLDSIQVRIGQFVKKGSPIARTGNTGISSGPHLHYEIQFVAGSLNPEYFLQWSEKNVESIFSRVKRVKWPALIELMKLRTDIPADISRIELASTAYDMAEQ